MHVHEKSTTTSCNKQYADAILVMVGLVLVTLAGSGDEKADNAVQHSHHRVLAGTVYLLVSLYLSPHPASGSGRKEQCAGRGCQPPQVSRRASQARSRSGFAST